DFILVHGRRRCARAARGQEAAGRRSAAAAERLSHKRLNRTTLAMTRVRKQLIAGNWKMYRGGAAGCELAAPIAEGCRSLVGADVVVAPPFTALAAVVETIEGSSVEVA